MSIKEMVMKENDFLFWLSGFLYQKEELFKSEVELVKEEIQKAIKAIKDTSKPIGFVQYDPNNLLKETQAEENNCPCDVRRGGSGICNCVLSTHQTTATRLDNGNP